ncbi:angiotensin-converting enzyme-like isoform X1 [Mercenaria mercenaria]|uniref:angiotensin-converting enzyme-like isoform X1 n=1 Tax=Mercenaria mercenaria TaxID=6596 RepID=UPI00234EDD33|nr:angiotensin-converting enzyme-like isoform X1 [Mercenaria mercenaria]
MRSIGHVLVLLSFLYCHVLAADDNVTEKAILFLQRYNREAIEVTYESGIKAWIYNTNITDYNSEQMVAQDLISANFTKRYAAEASQFDYKNFQDEDLKRQFASIAEQGTEAMKDPKKLERLGVVLSKMEGIYSKGKVCGVPPDYECLSLEPGLTRLMSESRDYDTLALIWKRWRDVAKGEMKELYKEFVELSNQGVRDGGHNDTGEYWRSWYESETFEDDLKTLLEELKPLYNKLHAYVRRKLQEQYKTKPFPTSGHIPAHLLGNMWAQSWINLYDMLEPYPGKESIDITPVLKARNFTALEMFKVAEDFFVSLGLREMPPEFWNYSMIERPTDGREVVCHASAWDFFKGNDVRIKMCTDITMDDLVTIHHEMGHIQYYLQYQNQPVVFRDGANPGFHEAIGDVMALSASTPKHLHAVGLLETVENNTEADINFLMRQALDKVSFIPFGYMIDQWRWSVFRGDTPPENYTSDWAALRCKYQGISPPVARSSEDFDPGAKYHIPGNTPYIRYFVSYVIQFQFHKALCDAAGETKKGPLYQCDIYNSSAAGQMLGKLLQQGSSKPWPDIFKEITGSPKMNATAILEYFDPLIKWLDEQNKGEQLGWETDCPNITEDIEEPTAKKWLEYYNRKASDMTYRSVLSQWNYGSNITDYNQAAMVNMSLKKSDFDKEMYKQANYFPWTTFSNSSMKRQFKMITNIGTNALDDKDQLKEMADLQAKIEGIYGKAKVEMSDGRSLLLEPGLTEILTSSRNYSELKEAWVKWREASGKLMKTDYAKFVELSNKAVRQLNYSDTGDYWRAVYETETFETDLQNLLEELKPLYKLLHGYVRKQLKKTYGAENFPSTGHIPAHLLGNMWGQQWNNIYNLVEPYKGVEKIDVTPEMLRQNYTVMRMFKTAEEFFTSLGLSPMPAEFWNGTIMVNPDGITMVCHASAWDFYNQKDFRIKMCTEVNMEEMIVIHHEMGHIQYFLQYKDQPVVFRGGANPGFHEAIGDVMALSVSTPGHLRTIGLLNDMKNSYESDINFLMKMALEKIAFLPFGYLIDQWRWSVFSGKTPPEKYNEKWWDLRCKYQGFSPPVERTEDDFDPGAKYHIPANVPYIRYFVSFVVQFQFHDALCKYSGYTGPLHRCDIYNSTNAGDRLRHLLQMGSSKPWTEAMMNFTGTDKMSVAPLMQYFKPLIDWLKNHVPDKDLGWRDECTHVTEADQLKDWLQQFEKEASDNYFMQNEAEWAYNTNITDETAEKVSQVSIGIADYEKRVAQNVSMYDWKEYKDDQLKRRLRKMSDIGTSALKNEDQLRKLSELKSSMESIYSTGKVCLTSGNCVGLDPELEDIMAHSQDYDKLTNVWKDWRDATGRKMKDTYAEFVSLSNAAIRELGYNDTGAYWRSVYDTETFQTDIETLLEQLKPLYQNLHTYVRRKLMTIYGQDKFPDSGHIPAHILGNMWAQEWNNIYKWVIPFKKKQNIDITPELVKQGYNATQLFRTAESFFTSLGLEPMREEFWNKSMIVRPKDREVVCHASAWDFLNGKDFRIKMCTKINMEDLVTIHHEMGHTQYQMQYRHQPIPFRDGANPGFHEAIGDVMALSAQTPEHLRKIKLLPAGNDDEESEINFLLMMALDKIAFLPFGYLIDQWRWSVFSGETQPEKYNEKWWQLRCKYQGVSPPVQRGSNDFDPGAKFHIPGNYPYIRYFVSYVIQFQFHKALCDAANHTGLLHRCDIYQSKEAGQKLMNMLKMGSSRPWPEAMEVMTGQRKMDAGPLMDYFRPLINWLEKQNYQERPGWSDACPETTPKVVVTCPNKVSKDVSDMASTLSRNNVLFLVLALIVISLFTL